LKLAAGETIELSSFPARFSGPFVHLARALWRQISHALIRKMFKEKARRDGQAGRALDSFWAFFYLITPGELPPNVDGPLPLNDAGPFGSPLGTVLYFGPRPMPVVRCSMEPLPTTPPCLLVVVPDLSGRSGPLTPLPTCASAKVLDIASAPASAIVESFMVAPRELILTS
jgi:hypothetical protein